MTNIYDNLILFSKKNDKNQAQIFYQNYSLALHTVEIFCNLILRNHWTSTQKIFDCLTKQALRKLFDIEGAKSFQKGVTARPFEAT